MRAVIQRVSSASVEVDGEVCGSIESGYLVYLGVSRDDDEQDLDYLVGKTVGLRLFNDPEGRMNHPICPDNHSVLVVSQFTLYGDVRKGRRPSWDQAADPEKAEAFYQRYIAALGDGGFKVQSGRFRTTMHVRSVNEGPVTLLLDSHKKF